MNSHWANEYEEKVDFAKLLASGRLRVGDITPTLVIGFVGAKIHWCSGAGRQQIQGWMQHAERQ